MSAAANKERDMDIGEPKFFKYVWRYNALAIAGTATLCGLVALSLVYDLVRNITRDREVSNVVRIDGEAEAPNAIKEVFTIGAPYLVAGTSYMQVPQYREQSQDRDYYSKESTQNISNYLFLNLQNNESKWLVSESERLFLSSNALTERAPGDLSGSGKALGIIYRLVDKDTNGDGNLTQNDAVTIAASGVDGSNFRKVLDGVTNILSTEQIAADRLLIFYQREDETISEIYSVPALVKLSGHTLSKPALK
ncbi:MAG: hypothetical protein ACRCU5_16115 [Rhizobiaceae bacterium]